MMRSFVSASLAAAAVPSRSRAAVLVRRRGTAAAAALATRRSDDHSSQHNGTSSSSQRGGQWERRRVGRGATAAAAAASTAAVAASSALLFSSSSATGTDASSSAATAMPLRDSSSSSSSPSPSSSSSSSPPEFLLRRRTSTPAVPHPGASPKPSSAGTRDICDDAPTLEMLPVYRSSDVAKNDGRDGRPIWMSYGGVVYDVTHFVPNHPGGTEKILTAAGAAIEPFWNIYRQHYSSDLPMRMMEQMMIGRLDESDQYLIESAMEVETDGSDHDPYSHEPYRSAGRSRHPALLVHNDQPMNAEVPAELLTRHYLTPNDLFYVRNHHPVPQLEEDDLRDYAVTFDLSALRKGKKGKSRRDGPDGSSSSLDDTVDITLDDLRTKFPRTVVTATLQCSGNRRADYDREVQGGTKRTTGTQWGQGAVSTARWGGVRLVDVVRRIRGKDGVDDDGGDDDGDDGIDHVIFESLDGMISSIPVHKALSPYGDVLLAYEMNGKPLSRDHGHPLRLVVPGYTAVRSVKWLSRVELSTDEAEGPWQRGLNYKVLPPGVTDANDVDLEKMPSVMEASVYSGITRVERVRDASPLNRDKKKTKEDRTEVIESGEKNNPSTAEAEAMEEAAEAGEEEKSGASPSSPPLRPGDRVVVRARGWAWAGGGRNVVRIDVTGDGGRTWTSADVKRGAGQRPGRAWAWVFWTADVPAVVVGEEGGGDGRRTVEVASKAVDDAFNIQPEHCDSNWNVRGLGNGSWYRATARLA